MTTETTYPGREWLLNVLNSSAVESPDARKAKRLAALIAPNSGATEGERNAALNALALLLCRRF